MASSDPTHLSNDPRVLRFDSGSRYDCVKVANPEVFEELFHEYDLEMVYGLQPLPGGGFEFATSRSLRKVRKIEVVCTGPCGKTRKISTRKPEFPSDTFVCFSCSHELASNQE